jgi:hypothetical protein
MARQANYFVLRVAGRLVIILDHRKHTRYNEKALITFGFLNGSARHLGFVENTSEYGLFFLADKPLAEGALVSIRPLSCKSSLPGRVPPNVRELAAAVCSGSPSGDHLPHRLNSMVVGRVVHCRPLEKEATSMFGIGAHYESPAV